MERRFFTCIPTPRPPRKRVSECNVVTVVSLSLPSRFIYNLIVSAYALRNELGLLLNLDEPARNRV
jgi:hypothetical protein